MVANNSTTLKVTLPLFETVWLVVPSTVAV